MMKSRRDALVLSRGSLYVCVLSELGLFIRIAALIQDMSIGFQNACGHDETCSMVRRQ